MQPLLIDGNEVKLNLKLVLATNQIILRAIPVTIWTNLVIFGSSPGIVRTHLGIFMKIQLQVLEKGV